MKCVCVAGARGGAGDLVDGKVVAGALKASLHEHIGGITVPINGTAFEFVHAAGGAGDRGLVSGWKPKPACWAAQGEITVPNVTKYGMSLGLPGPVNVSSCEFANSSMAGWCFISDWVSIDWLATNSHPFQVDISVD